MHGAHAKEGMFFSQRETLSRTIWGSHLQIFIDGNVQLNTLTVRPIMGYCTQNVSGQVDLGGAEPGEACLTCAGIEYSS